MSAVARLQTAWSANFFVVDQIIEARTHAVRAGILIRLPDAVIAARAEQLQDGCTEAGFSIGSDYVAIRLAHQNAQRDRRGNLPGHITDQLEYWRRGMVAISEGGQ